MKTEDDGMGGRMLRWTEHREAVELVQLFAFGRKPPIVTEPSGEFSQLSPSIGTNAALFRGDTFGRESEQVERRADRGGIARHG